MVVVENDDICSEKHNKKTTFYDDKIKWITVDNKDLNFNGHEYICMKCRFATKNLKDFKRHLNTKKHKKNPKLLPKTIKNKEFKCLCGKMYRFASGLSKHKTKCKISQKNGNLQKNGKLKKK